MRPQGWQRDVASQRRRPTWRSDPVAPLGTTSSDCFASLAMTGSDFPCAALRQAEPRSGRLIFSPRPNSRSRTFSHAYTCICQPIVSWTTRPPTIVVCTSTSFSASTGMSKGSSESTIRSASLPGSQRSFADFLEPRVGRVRRVQANGLQHVETFLWADRTTCSGLSCDDAPDAPPRVQRFGFRAHTVRITRWHESLIQQ